MYDARMHLPYVDAWVAQVVVEATAKRFSGDVACEAACGADMVANLQIS